MSNPIIDSVVVDSAVTQITVIGSGFKPSSSAPSVRFNDTVLTVTTSSDTSFVASLPSGLSAGSYLLEVENSSSFSNTTNFEVYISTPPSDLFGFDIQSFIIGYATNVGLSSTPITIPILGVGFSDPGVEFSGFGEMDAFRINIGSPLPSAAGDLSITLKDFSTGNSEGPMTILNGSISNNFSGSITGCSNGDALGLILSVSGSPVVLPRIQWRINR